MRHIAGAVIWVFFLLLAGQSLEYLAHAHISPVWPYQLYALLLAIGVALVLAHVRAIGVRAAVAALDRSARAFFATQAVLTIWILVRGNAHGVAYWAWPAANLLMGFFLFYAARLLGRERTLVLAAIAGLTVELATIYIDVWVPGTFAQRPERAAGLIQNPNTAAFFVSLLVAFLLPLNRSQPPRRWRLYMMFIAGPLVVLTISRSGWMMYLAVCAAFVYAARNARESPLAGGWRAHAPFACVYSIVVGLTLAFSGQLHATDAIAALLNRILPFGFDPPLTMDARSAGLRWHAAVSFLRVAWQHPILGMGAGYGYQFAVGPHNMFIALWVETGLPGLVLYTALLVILSVAAWRRRSPALLAIAAVTWLDSLVSHTVLIDPQAFVLAAAALGLASRVHCSAQATVPGRGRRFQQ